VTPESAPKPVAARQAPRGGQENSGAARRFLDRPDPDALLARLRDEAEQARRGRLKIFFGASAGVGKTFAMLQAAQAAAAQGIDVRVGVVETHGRAETEALLGGLAAQPLRAWPHRGRTLMEFDLDGVLQQRPALVLVDELAHANVPGSRHPKRWQDVEELLDAGIDVWSTMNVQHLDSLNDVVSGITGIRVWETVPDRVFDEAAEVVIVDLPPDELLQRLKAGKVYLPQHAETAARHFFRKGNLIALRELALRRTADRVDDQMLQYRRNRSVSAVWQTRESLLACIGADQRSEKIVRSAARLAGQLGVPWHCVTVETKRLPAAVRQRTLGVLKLAQELGASTATLSGSTIAPTLIRYAREHNLARIVLGRDTRRQPAWWRNSLAEAVSGMAGDLDVLQIALPPAERGAAGPVADAVALPLKASGWRWQPYAWSALVCAAVTLLTAPLHAVFDLSNIVMLFLLAVVLVAVRWGRGPAVLAAFLSVAAFDFFYVSPRFTFSVGDAQYLLTFAVMLAVALVIGQLTAGLQYQVQVATSREGRVSALYAMSRDLSGALLVEQIADIATRFVQSEFGARVAVLLADADNRIAPPLPSAAPPAAIDLGVAQWAYDHAEPAGQGTDTLPGTPLLYLPLAAPMRTRGVLALALNQPVNLLAPEQRRLLDTGASLLAIAIERIHYVEVAQSTTVQIESERLRNSLLSAISHDLRTPLAALVGLADSMALTQAAGDQVRIGQAMREAARRMSALVDNLLDMARLQAGRVELRREWQPIDEVVGSALRTMKPVLPGAHPLLTALPAGLPLVHIDAVLIERVLCNLLENAAKYTPAGSAITIGAASDGQRLNVWVDDLGPGLPPGREEALFDKFERGNKESATPGVGLGLAICRAIVEAHGGSIQGHNRPEGGARFSFGLPLGTPPSLAGADDEETTHA
jgi:two-component system sensor histidine kinase KdpD